MDTIEFALGPTAWSARQNGFRPISTLADIGDGQCLATRRQIAVFLSMSESEAEKVIAATGTHPSWLVNPITNGTPEPIQEVYRVPRGFREFVKQYL